MVVPARSMSVCAASIAGTAHDPLRRQGAAIAPERTITLKAMAEALNVSPAYLSALELGKRGVPTWFMVQRIIAFAADNRMDAVAELIPHGVAGDLADLRPPERLVAQGQAGDRKLVGDVSRQGARPVGVMVADHPDQSRRAGQGPQGLGVVAGQAILRLAIMEGVAQQDHGVGQGRHHLGLQAAQGLAGVVGRQHLAAHGVGRALLQVQVGDDEGPLLLQP